MNRNLLFIITLFLSLPNILFAQNLTGIWRGYFITDNGEHYRYEVQVEHVKGGLSGVTYSYQDRKFYGKATFTGNFNTSSQNALVQEIRTVEVRMALGSMSCIQKCLLTYSRSGKEEFLEGTFTSIFEKSDSIYGYRRGGDCGGGTMYLRKVPTSDFYLEPFLRKRTVQTNVPPVKNNTASKKPPVTSKPNNASSNTVTKKNTTTKPKNEPITKVDTEVRKETAKKINQTSKPQVSIPLPIKDRENNLVQTITVSTEEIIVKLYDNGEIDDDTISVYHNNKLVLSKKRLTRTALEIKLKMDENEPNHELIMVAENLGKIPPNTSLMIVNTGDRRYEVRITSTEQKNALVRFKYVKPESIPLPK